MAVKPAKSPYRTVALGKVHPNDWNPNVMPLDAYNKLKRGLKKLISQGSADDIPPIVVRRHPGKKGEYEIIDGFHRWKAHGELKQDTINVFLVKVDDRTARILTNTLNYLRGQPDRAKYAQGIADMLGSGASLEELADLLPDSLESLSDMIAEADVSFEAYQALTREEDEPGGEGDRAIDSLSDDTWVEVKFRMSATQAGVVEVEIRRIQDMLRGKNTRARALEMMAVNSSQTLFDVSDESIDAA